MVLQSRREYLDAIRQRYRRARKRAKTAILDEFCATCGYHRKYAIRLLRACAPRPARRRPGPAPRYRDEALMAALRRLWFATDQMCAKRLKAAIPLWLPFYEHEFGPLPQDVAAKLLCASAATLDRLLRPLRAAHPRRRCSTRPGTLLKNQIPIRTNFWEVDRPGFFEADTVAHGGNSMAGDFVHSLTFTDICSGWTENRAVWGRGSLGVLTQIQDIEAQIVFPLLGFDCDNGSEFLNHHLVRYFTDRPKQPALFSRSRPYAKNDNAFVEQKNWTHVRQLLGYDRLDNPAVLPLINELYANEWSAFTNFFCPTLKLKSKTRINAKLVRRYYAPQTPYERLLACEHLTPGAKAHLTKRFRSLNPFVLQRAIQAKLRLIFHTQRAPAPCMFSHVIWSQGRWDVADRFPSGTPSPCVSEGRHVFL